MSNLAPHSLCCEASSSSSHTQRVSEKALQLRDGPFVEREGEREMEAHSSVRDGGGGSGVSGQGGGGGGGRVVLRHCVGVAATAAAGSTARSIMWVARCAAGVPLVRRLRRRLWKRDEDGDPVAVMVFESGAEMVLLFVVLRWPMAAVTTTVFIPPPVLRKIVGKIARRFLLKPNIQNRLRDLGMRGARNWLLKQVDEAGVVAGETADEAWHTLQDNLPQSVLQQVVEVEAAAYAMVRNAAQGLTEAVDSTISFDAVRRTSASIIDNVNFFPKMYEFVLCALPRAFIPTSALRLSIDEPGPSSSSSGMDQAGSGDGTLNASQSLVLRREQYSNPKRIVEMLTARVNIRVNEKRDMLTFFSEECIAKGVLDRALLNEIALERFLLQSGGDMGAAVSAIEASSAWRGRLKFLTKDELVKREWSKYIYSIGGNDRKGQAAIVVKIGLACSSLPAPMLPEALVALLSVVEIHWLQTCCLTKPKRQRGQLSAIVDVEGATPLNTPVDLFIEGIVSLSQNYPGLGGDFHFVNVPTSLQPVAQLLSSLVMAGPRASRAHYHDLYSGRSELNHYFTLHQLPAAYSGKARYRAQGDTLEEEMARREQRIKERREGIKRWRKRIVYAVVWPMTIVMQLLRLLFVPLLASLVIVSQALQNLLRGAAVVEQMAFVLLFVTYAAVIVYVALLYKDGDVSSLYSHIQHIRRRSYLVG